MRRGRRSWTRSALGGGGGSRLRVVSEQSSSDVPKKPPVSEKDHVHLGVEQCGDGEGRSFAGLKHRNRAFVGHLWPRGVRGVLRGRGGSAAAYLDSELLPRTQAFWQDDAELLLPAELQRVGALAWKKLERHDAHPHQLAPVQLGEALGDDCANSLQAQQPQRALTNLGCVPRAPAFRF